MKTVTAPASSPSAIAAMKNVVANGIPNNPADRAYSSGLVSGEETRNATMGAHGTCEASAPRTTAVVPHEQTE
jgi:hypothetical protein